jgi:probable HAF family extracellular repeat protein
MGMRDLGSFGGGFSTAHGINDTGQVVGFSETAGGGQHAFITGPDGMGMRDLGTLGGTGSHDYSVASGINDAGQVAGGSDTVGNGNAHAFITGPNGMGMRDLGTLSGAFSSAFAYGINDAGQVVGASFTTAGRSIHAFITGPDGVGMTDLNSLVDLPDGVILTYAYDINSVGQVIASGSIIPEPQTYAMLLAGLGLIGFIARQKKMASSKTSHYK